MTRQTLTDDGSVQHVQGGEKARRTVALVVVGHGSVHGPSVSGNEVVEIFIDPDGDGRNYAEVEISPGNVVCDLLMFRGDPDKRSDLDWDFPGLQTAVHAWDSDTSGWTAVALLPWAGFATLPGTDMRLPPLAGDSWRFNVFRIKRPHRPDDPHRDLLLSAWSPVPGESFHVPEMFRPMVFK